MEGKRTRRVMLVIEAQMIPDDGRRNDTRYLLLVERADRRTWRPPTGEEILKLNAMYPNFFKQMKKGTYDIPE